MQRAAAIIAAPMGFGNRAFHSKRIIRRMKGHPKQWAAKPNPPEIQEPLYATQPLQAAPSGWVPPTGAVAADVPFRVQRTTAGNQLPVYTDFKNGRTRTLTVIRKVLGNSGKLAAEIRRVTGGAEVTIKPGRLEVEGDRSKELKTWLAGLGF